MNSPGLVYTGSGSPRLIIIMLFVTIHSFRVSFRSYEKSLFFFTLKTIDLLNFRFAMPSITEHHFCLQFSETKYPKYCLQVTLHSYFISIYFKSHEVSMLQLINTIHVKFANPSIKSWVSIWFP